MIHDCLYLLWIELVPHVVHVGPAALPSLWVPIGEEQSHLWQLQHLVVEGLHSNLIIVARNDELDISDLEEPLPTCQHL